MVTEEELERVLGSIRTEDRNDFLTELDDYLFGGRNDSEFYALLRILNN